MFIRRLAGLASLAALGAASVFSFAPLYLGPLMPVSLVAWLWATATAPNARAAALAGYVWGLGYFVANIHWIYISLHTFGGMPGWMAAGCTLLLSAYMALFPALAAWLGRKLPSPGSLRLPLLLPTLFCASEWLRGTLFTGFPWAEIGTSQIPSWPLAGYAPILGTYGVGWLLLVGTGLLVAQWRRPTRWIAVATLWLAGWGLLNVSWTTPVGQPVKVSLAQSNIAQDMKWETAHYVNNLRVNLQQVQQARGDIIVLPETAIPSFLADVPPWYLDTLRDAAGKRALVLGVPLQGKGASEYYNGAMVLTDPSQPVYKKQHLVPFGEFVPAPWLFGWMYRFLDMPLSGFSRGAVKQAPFVIGPTRLAANICYEDVFGSEIAQALPEATMLVNFSNLAWFDGSWAAEQQLQMSQARALETGRYMLRSTNTGATAIIDERGRVLARLPQRERTVLEGKAVNQTGLTPYGRWQNSPVLLIWLLSLLTLVVGGLRRKTNTNAF
ncbi:apolipoprotein N-acyltransferase [Jeongeupia naejangsanensis]|uniref:Apolipoprotein N-acyltransferase n=1 Tax=Jeongeupia naejangsanensis TaxID=613195 RepID=A0ABS2BQ59_9NEIS|nr:apolipoprotein N-acyltransferase [Jeongeupia naejangsanensis]MBM3117575.1 apolipoprotein N-acyltransferase [Jeongeupia naejangsanensis]